MSRFSRALFFQGSVLAATCCLSAMSQESASDYPFLVKPNLGNSNGNHYPSREVSIEKLLSDYEQILFGAANNTDSLKIRVSKIEGIVFGSKQKGNIKERLERIATAAEEKRVTGLDEVSNRRLGFALAFLKLRSFDRCRDQAEQVLMLHPSEKNASFLLAVSYLNIYGNPNSTFSYSIKRKKLMEAQEKMSILEQYYLKERKTHLALQARKFLEQIDDCLNSRSGSLQRF